MKRKIAAMALCLGMFGCSDSVSSSQYIPLEEVVDTVGSPEVVELPDTGDYPQFTPEPTIYMGYKAMRIDPVTPFIKKLEENLFYKKLKP
ncbi:hypothetical protein HOD05_00775 [Candidatus Woesearchaeota archaeon]|nr:hypothetical protein [Candidatus Woesearchaeota archaeon]MBT4150940.1 hypothetical protein [Candidatus Woesearchaeota archaeon]MBT4247085.1 hypothetical protein [Candidatus Woesearchaeota archaeon]MBT4433730.1 hypothetical protein [Candidatus Woesearchaeota archaeon]MBT7332261.1 hypothetical protein [Candidatus Woesearchaeota archaeon]